jgi:tripartite-type tricarboxylate transporter receptor subunit TctC
MIMRYIAVFALILAQSATALAPASADTYPSRQVRIVVGFPAGSAADITARAVGEHMSASLGQQIMVEVQPGAGSSMAAAYVARAAPDGYTLYIGSTSNVTNQAVNTGSDLNFLRDFAPIAPLTGIPFILAVHPSLGVNNFRELIHLAKKKPGELSYASVGVGTVPHLATELLAARSNVKFVHKPYQGSPHAMNDLLAGRVSFMLGVASTILPHMREGRVKGLATASLKRPQIARDLPTLAEAGLPGFDVTLWFGLLAPAGTPQPVIDKLNAAALAALTAPEVTNKLRASGFEPLGGSPSGFAKYIAGELHKWSDAVRLAQIKT